MGLFSWTYVSLGLKKKKKSLKQLRLVAADVEVCLLKGSESCEACDLVVILEGCPKYKGKLAEGLETFMKEGKRYPN